METSRKTTDELLELLKQKKSFDEYLQEGPEFVDMGLPQYLEEVMKMKGLACPAGPRIRNDQSIEISQRRDAHMRQIHAFPID